MSGAKNKSRRPAVQGICAAAGLLNVTRQHLLAVISGKRTSPKLLARYRALKAKQGEALKGSAA